MSVTDVQIGALETEMSDIGNKMRLVENYRWVGLFVVEFYHCLCQVRILASEIVLDVVL